MKATLFTKPITLKPQSLQSSLWLPLERMCYGKYGYYRSFPSRLLMPMEVVSLLTAS